MVIFQKRIARWLAVLARGAAFTGSPQSLTVHWPSKTSSDRHSAAPSTSAMARKDQTNAAVCSLFRWLRCERQQPHRLVEWGIEVRGVKRDATASHGACTSHMLRVRHHFCCDYDSFGEAFLFSNLRRAGWSREGPKRNHGTAFCVVAAPSILIGLTIRVIDRLLRYVVKKVDPSFAEQHQQEQ